MVEPEGSCLLFNKKGIIVFAIILIGFLCSSWLVLRFSKYQDWDLFVSSKFSPIIVDRNGEELRVVPLEQGLRRIYTPLEEYPGFLVDIFIASEDKRFFLHQGVDLLAMCRALYQNVKAGYIVSGASTISMQLASLAQPEPATIKAKLREISGALRIEARHSKKFLLELWLSSLPFGNNVQGIGSAGRYFFHMQPSELTLEQCLLLAVIPRRPEMYNPSNNPQKAVEAAYLLSKKAGIETSIDALKKAVTNSFSKYEWPYNAPHFVEWVIPQLTLDDYHKKYPIKTTLDSKINNVLQGAIETRIARSERYRISNGSGLIINPKSGEILGYIGSSDFFDEEHSGQIDGVQILRQPGSTLKPFLYAKALESGYSASSVLPDIPMIFGNEQAYIPQNYNQRYNGPVRLRTALSSSLNIPAVYLTEKIGVGNFVDLLINLGFNSLKEQRDQLGVGIALGNAEISLFELTRAYAIFPRDGYTVELVWRLEKNNEDFKIASDKSESQKEIQNIGKQVFKNNTCFLIRDILSDNVNRILGFGRRGIGIQGFDAMLKTGTSNQFNNIWAVGATPAIVCSVWMGNFSGETVIGSPGSGIPADAVIDILSQLQNGEKFQPMSGFKEIAICPLSGCEATEACPSKMSEYFRPGEEPNSCDFHVKVGSSVTINYPPEYRDWANIYGISFNSQEVDYIIKIVKPADGAVFFLDSNLPFEAQGVPIEVDGSGIAELIINGDLVKSGHLPYRWFLPMERGFYNITAINNEERQDISIELR